MATATGSKEIDKLDVPDRNPFVQTLYLVLEECSKQDFKYTGIRWTSGGDAIEISQPCFVANTLSVYYRTSKYKSFTRLLNKYGFKKNRASLGIYSQPEFRQSDFEAVKAMRRPKRTKNARTAAEEPPQLCVSNKEVTNGFKKNRASLGIYSQPEFRQSDFEAVKAMRRPKRTKNARTAAEEPPQLCVSNKEVTMKYAEKRPRQKAKTKDQDKRPRQKTKTKDQDKRQPEFSPRLAKAKETETTILHVDQYKDKEKDEGWKIRKRQMSQTDKTLEAWLVLMYPMARSIKE